MIQGFRLPNLGKGLTEADFALVIVGAALVALLAQARVPMWPVPVTGQTLGALLAGASLGAVRVRRR